MGKYTFFVCDNFYPEFKKVIENEKYDDIFVKSFPRLCESKKNENEVKKMFFEFVNNNEEGQIYCGKKCTVLNEIPNNSSLKIHSSEQCFFYYANETFMNYVISKGGYIIGVGWLNNWEELLEKEGFSQSSARSFYKDFCKELVFFDSGIDETVYKKLSEVSRYLDISYIVIPFTLETISILIKGAVNDWRLNKKTKEYASSILEIKTHFSEVSSVIESISKISSYSNKRETIDRIKDVFVHILGSRHFHYWDIEAENLPNKIKELIDDKKRIYLNLDNNKFCVKILNNENELFGVFEAGDFISPQNYDNYLNIAIDISFVCGMVLTNIEQYDKLIKVKNELEFISTHDTLTGLYNRTYVNELLKENESNEYLAVFLCDIDKLKFVNDNFGHLEGDKLIINISNILKKCFRESDIIARIGEDEFVAILPNCDINMAEIFENRISKAINSINIENNNEQYNLSVSLGFAVANNKVSTIEKLMKQADILMHKNKSKKKRTK